MDINNFSLYFTTKIRKRKRWFLPVILCMPAFIVFSAQAGDNYWTGDSGLQDWKYTGNWSLGDVPADGDNAYLIDAGTVNLNMADPNYPVPLNGFLQSLVVENGTLIHGGYYTLNIVAPPDPPEPWNPWTPPAIGFGVNGTYSLHDNGTLNSARTVVGVERSFDSDSDPTNNPPLIGGAGLGVFNQGGTSTANHGQLWLGFNNYGEYNLSNGTVIIGGYEMGTLVIGGKDWYGKTFVGEGVFNQDGGDVYANGLGLFMADGPGTKGTYNLQDGTLTVGGYYVIGGGGGTATFSQSGGTNTANGMLEVGGAGTGTYNLNSGDLNTATTIIGAWGIGTFNQEGGSHLTRTLEVGSHGSGTYNQTGGNVEVTADGIKLLVGGNAGSNGSYNLSGSGSSVTAPEIIVGAEGIGAFTQGGTTQVVTSTLALAYNTGGSGTYTLNNGTLTAGYERIGMAGTGSFVQNGGLNSVQTRLDIGQEVGTTSSYEINDGTLQAERVWVGPAGTGNFNQWGGDVAVTTDMVLGGVLYSGDPQPGVGTYTITNDSLAIGNELIVGNRNAGTFNQQGGTIDVSNTLYVAKAPGSSGTYNLRAGILNVPNIINNDKFNFSGGTLNASNITNNTVGTANLIGTSIRTVNGSVANAGTVNVDTTTAIFTDNVTNTGTFKITDSTVTYTSTFTNAGAYISDPSSSFFTNFIVESLGYLKGADGDLFSISGAFLNSSTSHLWDTEKADLNFTGAGFHDFKMGPDGNAVTFSLVRRICG